MIFFIFRGWNGSMMVRLDGLVVMDMEWMDCVCIGIVEELDEASEEVFYPRDVLE